MSRTRPTSPKATLWAGLGLITFALVGLPLMIRDPGAIWRSGAPAWLALTVMLVLGVCLATFGAIRLRAARRSRRPHDGA